MAGARTRDMKAERNINSCNVRAQSKLQHLSVCNIMFKYYLDVTSREESPSSFGVDNEKKLETLA